MAQRGDGHILNNASTAGLVPLSTTTGYSARHYERSFSEALAEELVDTDVIVTGLCSGTRYRVHAARERREGGDLMDPTTVAQAVYEGRMNGERVGIPGGSKTRLGCFSVGSYPRDLCQGGRTCSERVVTFLGRRPDRAAGPVRLAKREELVAPRRPSEPAPT